MATAIAAHQLRRPGLEQNYAHCRYLWALLSVTGGAYLGALGLAGVLFYFFKPSGAGDCSFNVTMITFTLILGLAMTGVSMTPTLVSRSFS